MTCCFLTLLGLYALCWYLYENLRSPFLLFRASVRRVLGHEPILGLKERYGSWAAITGATDGIGREYARELARQGLNVVLISRTETKLQDVARNIEFDFGVQSKYVVADFSHGQEIYKHIENELQDIPIGILVNNVGQNTPRVSTVSSCESADIWSLLFTNIGAVSLLSHMFLRRMKRNNVKGLIVNISSGTEMFPLPYGALYAASKAYNRSLTLALQEEARPYGITVQLVSPNFVVTKINSYSRLIMRGGLFIPQPDQYARWAVSTIGKVDMTTGYFWHGLQTAVIRLIPWRVCMYLAKVLAEYLNSKKNFK